jgi:hypothetical protein
MHAIAHANHQEPVMNMRTLSRACSFVGMLSCTACADTETISPQVGASAHELTIATDVRFDDQTCTPDQKDQLRDANSWGAQFAYSAYEYYISDPTSEIAVRWFGEPDHAAEEQVAGVLNGVVNTFANHATLFRCNDPTQSDYAEVDSSMPNSAISIAPGFWGMSLMGINSRSGTVAHELTHWFGTVDNTDLFQGIGYDQARQLTLDSPDMARQNAISYQYFIEETNNPNP